MKRCLLHMSILVMALIVAAPSTAAEKGKKAAKREAARERAVMGDSIAFALLHDDDLKLNKEQKTYLQKLKQSLADEREKEKEEIEIKEMREDMRAAQKGGRREEAASLKEKMRALMEKQAIKWEDRSNAELAKILPKDMQAKLKELRGEPDKLPENPFGNN